MRTLAKQLAVRLAETPVGRRMLSRRSTGFVPVFMMHRFRTPDGRVQGHNPELVREALVYLRAHGFHVLTVDEVVKGLVEGSLPERAVAFTIDDGYFDQATVGAEAFLSNDCPVTIYLVTGMVDGSLWPWEAKLSYVFSRAKGDFMIRVGGREVAVSPRDRERMNHARRAWVHVLKALPLSEAEGHVVGFAATIGVDLPRDPPPEFMPMSWQQARALEARGVSFGGHTVSHVTLSAEQDETARRELEASTLQLQRQLNHPSRVFCYPTGRASDYGPREIAYLRELGYAAAMSSEPGYCSLVDGPDARFHLRRFSFPDNMVDFKDIVLQLQRFRVGRRFARTT